VLRVAGRYLQRLAAAASRPLRVMQSNGGVISVRIAGQQAARTVCRTGRQRRRAYYLARLAGFEEAIGFDMGGTSTDVCRVRGAITPAKARSAGCRCCDHRPATVGAGGGSLAGIDAGGALRVGPQSAGALPGPACYGRGGEQATVTDAHLVLGRLDPARFLGGRMPLDSGAARDVLARLAHAMGAAGGEQAAWGVLQVANAAMERAVRRVTVERGSDPRRCTLVAFGGAGRCTPASWPRASASAGCWCRAGPACSPRSACWWPTSCATRPTR
jgi:N-methylhydantoinase A